MERKLPTDSYDLVARIRAYVQSGEPKTVRQVFDRFQFDLRERLEGDIGSMICRRYWKVGAFKPSARDEAARSKGDTVRKEVHAEIGKQIAANHIDSEIEVIKPWGESGESKYLKAVKAGVCTGCGQRVTQEMQHDLKLSKRAYCKKCGVTLFGTGV